MQRSRHRITKDRKITTYHVKRFISNVMRSNFLHPIVILPKIFNSTSKIAVLRFALYFKRVT